MSETTNGKSHYKARKAARLRGEAPKGRGHEPAPWYTFRIPSVNNPSNVIEDGRMRVERELREFGDRCRKTDEERRARAASRIKPTEEVDAA
jgi:hypothetical protein